MKTPIFRRIVIYLIVIMVFSKFGYTQTIGFTQSMGVFKHDVQKILVTSTPQTITPIPLIDLVDLYNGNMFFAKKGGCYIKLYLEDAFFGKDNVNTQFKYLVSFDIRLYDYQNNQLPVINYKLEISNERPVQMLYFDMSQYISNNSQGYSATPSGYNISKIEIVNIYYTNIPPYPEANNYLKLSIADEFEYGIKIENTPTNYDDVAINGAPTLYDNSKAISFNWTATEPYPNYEFQLLRLYNTSSDNVTNEKNISAIVDWSQAMKLELESSNTNLVLTMGEGTGYYAWRVRPIGTLDGGYANNENWGKWNDVAFIKDSPPALDITENSVPSGVFYYNDVDENINYIYSRVITEGNKISENITYATVLNQVRQKQVFNQTDNKTIAQQIILDRNGRPAIQTLPAPVNPSKEIDRLSGYIDKLTKPKVLAPKSPTVFDLNDIYNSKNFDLDHNSYNPDMMTGKIADYYSDNLYQIDKTVPNSEDYPFSRTIYANDNTGNVIEVSGVGKTHMISNIDNTMGKTTKTSYETASDQELVKLFGDEAPAPNTVQKITTTDPNNISTTNYVTAEGKTIATSITYNDLDNPYDDTKFTTSRLEEVVADVTTNTKIEESFISSKKFNFLIETPILDFKYKLMESVVGQLCADINVKCSYNLDITFSKADGTLKYIAKQIKITKNSEYYHDPVGSSEGYYEIDYTNIDFTEASDPSGTLIRPFSGDLNKYKGEYVIEKKLTPNPAEENSVTITDPTNGVNIPLENIAKWVNKLGEINCYQELYNFYNDLYKIAFYVTTYVPGDVDGGEAGGHTRFFGSDKEKFAEIFDKVFDEKYKRFITPKIPIPYTAVLFDESNNPYEPANYDVIPTAPEHIPDHIVVTSPCCNVNVKLLFTPDYQCPTPADLIAIKNFIDNQLVAPNPDMYKLFVPDEDYVDNMLTIGGKDLSNTSFTQNEKDLLKKIPDFEGYAISMITAAGPVDELTAKKILYTGYNNNDDIKVFPLLQGWNNKIPNTEIYEGTSEVQRMVISGALL